MQNNNLHTEIPRHFSQFAILSSSLAPYTRLYSESLPRGVF